jgi:hypothetical protein
MAPVRFQNSKFRGMGSEICFLPPPWAGADWGPTMAFFLEGTSRCSMHMPYCVYLFFFRFCQGGGGSLVAPLSKTSNFDT